MGIKPQTFLTMEEVAAIRKCESDGFSECLEFFTVRLSTFSSVALMVHLVEL